MSINTNVWGTTIAELERLIGPMQSHGGTATAFEVMTGQYEGVPVRVSWLGRMSSGTRPAGAELRLAMPLQGRPVHTYVWARSNSVIFGPTATTGDESFDARYIAAANPPEVVSAALDDEVRAMIERRWSGADTSLLAQDDWVSMSVGSSQHGAQQIPSGPELQAALEDLRLFWRRLRDTYDAQRRQLVETGGEDAALQWEAEARTALQKRESRRLLIVFGALAAVGAVVVIIVAVIMFLIAFL